MGEVMRLKTFAAGFLILSFCGAAAASVDPDSFFEPTFNDLPEELALAESEGKRLVIMYEQEGCPFCWKMRRDVLSREDVHDYYHKRYRIIQMDIRGSLSVTDFDGEVRTQKEFSIRQNVRHTPAFIFYDENGGELHRLIGFYSKEEFLLAGEYVESGAYEGEDFSLWMKRRKEAGNAR